jgi:Reverse transcriptase (RNA-dependent DNA polymerase)
MNNVIKQITNHENLLWAWNKAKYLYKPGDIWFNEISVSNFEANLKAELESIKDQIANGTYRLTPIRPVAFPKAPKNDVPRTRQTFEIAVRDQVTWLALTNIIGPALDYEMPFWSYGNRLFISVFYKFNEQNQKNDIKFGWYRNTSRYLYRKWNQSWPLYRRHITITARIMAKQNIFQKNIEEFKAEELEGDKEVELLEQNDLLPLHLRIAYLKKDYWKKKLSGDLYWAGIDLKKFYPNINLATVLENFKKYYPSNKQSSDIEPLLSNLLNFQLNAKGWSQKELEAIDIKSVGGAFRGIPTGLFVAGFLANVALLDIDKKINDKMLEQKNIAHFRFVDDHVILADSYENLENWIIQYEKLLSLCDTGACISIEKTEPEELSKYLEEYWAPHEMAEKERKDLSLLQKEARKKTELDPDFPSPLMTQTLAKVSQIAQTNFNLLDIDEEEIFIADLEHLLVTEFPDQELRKDTRISFAASMLSRLAPRRITDYDKLYEKEKKINQLLDDQNRLMRDKNRQSNWREQVDAIKQNIKNAKNESKDIEKDIERIDAKNRRHIFNLLLKAVRENHEKVRLWTRLFEFCRRSGEDNLHQIIELLAALENKNIINKLSKDFIYVLILQILIEQVSHAYLSLTPLNETYRITSYDRQDRAKRFLRGVLKNNFLKKLLAIEKNADKVYVKETIDEFKFFLGSIIYLDAHDNHGRLPDIKRCQALVGLFNLMDWHDADRFVSKTSHTLGEWLWWLTGKLSAEMSSEPNVLWKKYSDLLTLNTPVESTLISLYPKKITEVLEERDLEKKLNHLGYHEGWWYDFKVGLNNKPVNYSNKYLKQLKLKEKQRKSKTNYICLYDWTNWATERIEYSIAQGEPWSNLFDPRYSEWTALEIVKQIAVKYGGIHNIAVRNIDDLHALANNSGIEYIHPTNYLIPIEWTKDEEDAQKLTWEIWKKRTNMLGVEFTEQRAQINDIRYTPTIEDSDNIRNAEMTIIYGLGIILIGLITRNFDFPPFWNITDYQRDVSLIRKKLGDSPVSSQTLTILDSCFSKKNRETRLLKSYQQVLRLDDDTQNDPPEIFTINDLIAHIKKAQDTLKLYQLTVQGHEPRQLIPVSLIKLSRSYNPYDSETEDYEKN